MRAQGIMDARRWWLISILLTGIGLLQSSYLLSRSFALWSSAGPPGFDLCAVLAMSCDGVLADDRFGFLGVPLAGWGLVYFTTVAGLLFLGRFLRRSFEAEVILAAILVVIAGLMVGLVLTVRMAWGHEPACPICLSFHANSLFLLFALQRASARSISEQARQLGAAVEGFLRPGRETPEPMRWKLVGFACVVLVAAITYQWVFVESELRRPRASRAPSRAEVLAAYRASPSFTLPVTDEDPHMGPLTAPVRLVVFESFRCPACRKLAGALTRLRNRFRDQLLIVYKHYPLSTECNDRLTRDMQPGACEIAWAAEAAHRQARFWEFHDLVFAAETAVTPQKVADVARDLRFDPERFAADRASDLTRERVAHDVALGNRLKLPGTPSVFLDGRLVTSPGPEALEILIRHQLHQRVSKPPPTSTTSRNEAGRGLRSVSKDG